MTRFLAVTMVLLLGCSSDDQTPFQVNLEIRSAPSAPEGHHYVVNGAATSGNWNQIYEDLSDSCTQLAQAPLSVQCLTIDDEPCGAVEIASVCCWAPNLLSSPVVQGTVYVEFAEGATNVDEGDCIAQDGSSTHGDGPGPDAGS